MQEKIWEDRKAIGDKIEVHSPKKAVKDVLKKPKKELEQEIKKDEIIQPVKKFQYF